MLKTFAEPLFSRPPVFDDPVKQFLKPCQEKVDNRTFCFIHG